MNLRLQTDMSFHLHYLIRVYVLLYDLPQCATLFFKVTISVVLVVTNSLIASVTAGVCLSFQCFS